MFDVEELCKRVKKASFAFTKATTADKNAVLLKIKEKIDKSRKKIAEQNALDLVAAETAGVKGAFLDRLTLTDKRIDVMLAGIDDVVALPDYVGMVEEEYTVKSGLRIKKVHAPLGVVGIIYESRPNVTVDAAALCIKSGNGVVLKGGKEAINTNRILVRLMREAFSECGLDGDIVGFVDGTERELTLRLLKCASFVDVIIPRGGEKLKKFVQEEAAMPVIASSGGNCHVFVEKTADFTKANRIVLNAKLSRPSVCNAAETLLVDRAIAKEYLPPILAELAKNGVEIRGTEEVKKIFPSTKVIDEDEFFVEYEDLIIKVKVVEDYREAIEHINEFGTHHSDAVVTEDDRVAEDFTREVDSGAVYVNASTRFTDGYEFGLGAEMGISTQKLHVRGPIGLKELTSVKYVVTGDGTVRE
ncbi:MAG: glutamate-5-semialdehyde dehydrogenase [Clostridia bacterium]|nr:glutamate-5-semialdehyde dehydrogenase [Clostridia bacterium]